MLKFWGYGNEVKDVEIDSYGVLRTCEHCGKEIDSVDYEPLSKEWTDQLNSDLKFYDDLYEQIISDRKKFK